MKTALAKLFGHKAECRQALRVALAALVTFILYKWLHLPQGYWAVFTVVIVMQGSVGGTLGAAGDRLLGTLAGALFGGMGALLAPAEGPALPIVLGIVIGVTAFAAALRPRLRIAPVTAAIVLLSRPPGLSAEYFVVDRVIEIMLGGLIGILATLLLFPARSRGVVATRAAAVLDGIEAILLEKAAAVTRGEAAYFVSGHVALRKKLAAVDDAVADSGREHRARLSEDALSPALARTLWRVRNDLVLIGRTLDQPLPQAVAPVLAPATAEQLRAEAKFAALCAAALRTGTAVVRSEDEEERHAFADMFDGIRHEGLTRDLDFEDAGRVFGLAFTLERLHRDFADLAERIGEIATGKRPGPASAASSGKAVPED
ncbi:FUSC family protein [Flavisphingomonas formosensis]|uniref:FUSC family protein n=1 Tax=Flavisphingomonas formosensis TaxID=861534 RepID=UPI0012FC47E6|nr:FUSC family protein [Sphingomonas formosensis]